MSTRMMTNQWTLQGNELWGRHTLYCFSFQDLLYRLVGIGGGGIIGVEDP